MSDNSSSGAVKIRERLLKYMPEAAAQHGWNAMAVRQAAQQSGVDAAEMALAAAGGDAAFVLVGTLLSDWAEQADAHTRLVVLDLDPDMRIRDRIAAAVRSRMTWPQPPEAARAATLATMAPWRTALAANILFRSADNIWSAMDDKSTDHNWYSKRLILSVVIADAMSVWLEQGQEEAWLRLDAGIEKVMRFEKFKRYMRKNDKCPGGEPQ